MTNYTKEEEKLAREFADALDDHESLAMHLSYVRYYEEWSLRKLLKKALDIPDEDVRTNRAACYNSSVQYNGVLKGSKRG
jgi:hypothetical protein